MNENDLAYKKVLGMKNLHVYFICIIIVPLMLGVIIVTLLEGIMIKWYFEMMIENISSEIKVQTSTIQSEMILSNKQFLADLFGNQFMESIRIRNMLIEGKKMLNPRAPPLGTPLNFIQELRKQIVDGKIKCLESVDINYKTFPACVDLNYIGDYKTSSDPYKINLGHALAIMNSDLNAKNQRRRIQDWQSDKSEKDYPEYIDDLTVILSLSPLLMSSKDNTFFPTFDLNRFMKSANMIISPKGILSYNYFNYEFVNNKDITKEDCLGLHESLPPTIKFDPRCRPWYRHTMEFSCAILKSINANKTSDFVDLTPENNYFPIVVIPEYVQLLLSGNLILTITTVDYFKYYPNCNDGKINQNADSYVIQRDIYLDNMLDSISRAYAQSVLNYLQYTDSENADKLRTKLTLEQMYHRMKEGRALPGEPDNGIKWLRKVTELTNDAYRFYFIYLDKTLKYEIYLSSREEGQYNALKNPYQGDKALLYEEEKKVLKGFTDNNTQFSLDLKPASTIYYVLDFPVSVSNGRVVRKKVNGMIDSIGAVDYTTKRYIEVFKILVIVPEYLISDKYDVLVSKMTKEIVRNSIIAFCVVFCVLIVGLVVIARFASKVVRHLKETGEVAEKVERGDQIYQDRNDLLKNMNYEIMQTKNALFDLNNIFNNSNVSSTKGEDGFEEASQEDKNVLRYAFRIRLFSMLNDNRMIGILNNNLGVVHYNAGRFEEAVDTFQASLEILENMNSGSSDGPSMNEDEFQRLKCERTMNQALSLKKQIETSANKELQKIEKLRRLVGFVKDKVSDSNHEKHIKCSYMLAWASRQKDEVYSAVTNLAQATERLQKYKGVLDEANRYTYFLYLQEIDYEKAQIHIREKKPKKALALVTAALTRDEHFELGMRSKLVALLVDIFGLLNYPLTPGVLELKERFTGRLTMRKYVIALDYSGSMKYGNKIDNSVKAILDIWDRFVRMDDKVAFLRFNINCEIIFGLEEKRINTFSKKVEIEKSGYPRDRTSFFDAVAKCCEVINKDKSEARSKNYIILICDGDDTSSLKQQNECLETIKKTNAALICIGLNLKDDSRTIELMKTASRASKDGIYLDINEANFEILFQVISQYADHKKPYSELNVE